MGARRARGPNGVGTVYQEPKRGNAWCAEAFVRLPDGRRRRVRGRGPTVEAAVKARALAERRLLEGHPTAERLTVAQLAERWLATSRTRGWAAETKRSYETALNLHILPRLGAARVALVTGFDVQRALDQIEHVSVANRCRRVMHTMFQQAVKWGVIPGNPVANVDPVTKPSGDRGWWTAEQARMFLDAAAGSPHRDAFHALIVTGLRVGELIALRWGDVRGGEFHVTRTFSQSAPGKVQERTKSRTSTRRVPVPPELLDRLEARRGSPADLVFPSERGTMLNPSNMRRGLHIYAERAGVPVIRIHDLRRTYASLLAVQGYHPSVIQRLLGHASPELALRVYTSVADATVAGAVVALGGNVGGSLSDPQRSQVGEDGGVPVAGSVGDNEETSRAPVAQLDRAGDS